MVSADAHEPGRVEIRVGGGREGRLGAEPGRATPRRSTRSRSAHARRCGRCRRGGSRASPVARPGSPARICWAGQGLRRSTQVSTVRMSAPSRAAACSRGPATPGPAPSSGSWSPRAARWPSGAEPTSTRDRAWPVPRPRRARLQRATSAAGRVRRCVRPIPSGRTARHRPSARASGRRWRRGRRVWSMSTPPARWREHVGNDQRRRLSRTRRAEDHHRMLRLGEAPSAFVMAEVRGRVRRAQLRPKRRDDAL